MLTECILRFPELGRTSEIQNGDDGAAQHTSAGRKLGITCGGEEKWEEKEKKREGGGGGGGGRGGGGVGPLTQIEGDTFRVAGDGRWWKERRADGGGGTKSLATCLSLMQDSRRALQRSAVGGEGFPRRWEILLFLKKADKEEKKS